MTITAEGRTRMLRASIAAAVAVIAGAVILLLWISEAWADFLGTVLTAGGAIVLGFILAVIATDKPGRHAGS